MIYRNTAVYESKNYYNIAHELKEDVKQQPSILVGGTLKEYQVCAVVAFRVKLIRLGVVGSRNSMRGVGHLVCN